VCSGTGYQEIHLPPHGPLQTVENEEGGQEWLGGKKADTSAAVQAGGVHLLAGLLQAPDHLPHHGPGKHLLGNLLENFLILLTSSSTAYKALLIHFFSIYLLLQLIFPCHAFSSPHRLQTRTTRTRTTQGHPSPGRRRRRRTGGRPLQTPALLPRSTRSASPGRHVGRPTGKWWMSWRTCSAQRSGRKRRRPRRYDVHMCALLYFCVVIFHKKEKCS